MDLSEIYVELKRFKDAEFYVECDFHENRYSGHMELKIESLTLAWMGKSIVSSEDIYQLSDFFLDEITEIIKQVKEEVDNRITNQESI